MCQIPVLDLGPDKLYTISSHPGALGVTEDTLARRGHGQGAKKLSSLSHISKYFTQQKLACSKFILCTQEN